jgi:hypothetical protein
LNKEYVYSNKVDDVVAVYVDEIEYVEIVDIDKSIE